MQPKILLADDHSMIRKGIKILCESNLGYKGVEEVANCNQLMKALARKDFTHLVLDINLSDGSSLEILPNIRSLYPSLKITILSMQPADVYDKAMRHLGISHYISKSSPEEETVLLLRKFLQNDSPARMSLEPKDKNPFQGFTRRELEVLHYMIQGVGTNDIAKSLNLKWNTISTVKNRIFEKTNTKNIIELKELANLFQVC